MQALLAIRDLVLEAQVDGAPRAVVERLSLAVRQNESMALVGESGSGKTLTALAIMGLLPEPAVTVAAGSIELGGVDLLAVSARERRAMTGRDVAMVFQEPMTALNPVVRIGDQIVEMIRAHEPVSRRAARARVEDLLAMVRMPEPTARLRAYPHQLSGGQRQRVMIAMALACRPRLLIADEPTTALDVTVQARILALLRERQAELDMAMLFITHDLGVVANVADRVAVIYCGQIGECGPVERIYRTPAHPYTRALLACVPDAGRAGGLLATIPGQLPAPADGLTACRFAPRCALADEGCRRIVPHPVTIAGQHEAFCHHPRTGAEP
ncbi:MAG: ABC transporter ATP-binding protein [Spirochaetaceae bacterium]|nr:ABC transporter ATP-binding protein [Spirochaetaceae bacterium]